MYRKGDLEKAAHGDYWIIPNWKEDPEGSHESRIGDRSALLALFEDCRAALGIDTALVAERAAAKRLRDAADRFMSRSNNQPDYPQDELEEAIAAFDATQADEKERT